MRERKEKTVPEQTTVKALKQCLARVALTDDGLELLQYMAQTCGFSQPSISADLSTGEININSTIYNEARRGVWLELRQMLPYDRLAAIELPPAKPKEVIEDGDS